METPRILCDHLEIKLYFVSSGALVVNGLLEGVNKEVKRSIHPSIHPSIYPSIHTYIHSYINKYEEGGLKNFQTGGIQEQGELFEKRE